MEKRVTKKELKLKAMQEAQRKAFDKAMEYPFCRRCRAPLEGEWLEELKKNGGIPLCKDCHPLMMALYTKCIDLWQKFSLH